MHNNHLLDSRTVHSEKPKPQVKCTKFAYHPSKKSTNSG